ncbi:MAG: hypothetical protein ACLFU8_15260, partial [Anaerolineales bacterium]
MRPTRDLIWWLTSLFSVIAGLLGVAFAVQLALFAPLSAIYRGNLTSLLAADYSAEPREVPQVARVRPEVVEEVLEEDRRIQEEEEAREQPGIVPSPEPRRTSTLPGATRSPSGDETRERSTAEPAPPTREPDRPGQTPTRTPILAGPPTMEITETLEPTETPVPT